MIISPTVELLFGLATCFATYLILRGGWTSPYRTTIIGLDPQGLGLSALAVAAAVWFFGPTFGLSLILIIVIHEFGHVAAFRIAGHQDASFRLVPLLGGYAISNRPVEGHDEDVFISLMGPAICIAPMMLAYGIEAVTRTINPEWSIALLTFASVCGALNFFNLLPIWPLDGGKLTASILSTYHERLPFFVFAISTALIGVLALLNQSIFLIFIVVMGVQHLVSTGGSDGRAPYRRMSKQRATLCLFAWLFTAAALFWGGLGTILRFV
ncbi:MAG: site-2 protease family protein [Pseudomonadota bacterium]